MPTKEKVVYIPQKIRVDADNEKFCGALWWGDEVECPGLETIMDSGDLYCKFHQIPSNGDTLLTEDGEVAEFDSVKKPVRCEECIKAEGRMKSRTL